MLVILEIGMATTNIARMIVRREIYRGEVLFEGDESKANPRLEHYINEFLESINFDEEDLENVIRAREEDILCELAYWCDISYADMFERLEEACEAWRHCYRVYGTPVQDRDRKGNEKSRSKGFGSFTLLKHHSNV